MNKVREQHQQANTSLRFMLSVGLAGTVALTSSSGWISQAQTRPTTSSLPKVEAETTVPTRSADGHSMTTIPKGNTSSTASARFFCQVWNGQYTVMYSPENRSEEVFPWAVPQTLGNGWGAEKRCNEISRRLEEYRSDGLQELSTSTLNGYNIVCATTQSKSACRIVFTVPPGQDPVTTRNSVFQNLTVADSGTMTQGVNTYVGSGTNVNLTDNLVNLGLAVLGRKPSWKTSEDERSAINLRPYLAPSDGGTGTGMKNGVRLQKGLRLNPNHFR